MKLENTSKKLDDKFIDLSSYVNNLKTSNDDYEIAKIHFSNSNPFLNLNFEKKVVNDKVIKNSNLENNYFQDLQLNVSKNNILYFPRKVNNLEDVIDFERSYKIQIPYSSRLKYYR